MFPQARNGKRRISKAPALAGAFFCCVLTLIDAKGLTFAPAEV